MGTYKYYLMSINVLQKLNIEIFSATDYRIHTYKKQANILDLEKVQDIIRHKNIIFHLRNLK